MTSTRLRWCVIGAVLSVTSCANDSAEQHSTSTPTTTPATLSPVTTASAPSPLVVSVDATVALPILQPTAVPYAAAFTDPNTGITLRYDDGGIPEGPVGFGVEPNGTLHVADGTNARVLVIAPNGQTSFVAYPELDGVVIAGFTTGPDGTDYFALADGLAVGRDGRLTSRLTSEQLGWSVNTHLVLQASDQGVWVAGPSGGWSLAVDPSGTPVTGVRSPADGRPGVDASQAVACQAAGEHAVIARLGDTGETVELDVDAQPGKTVTPTFCTRSGAGSIIAVLNDGADFDTNALVIVSGDTAAQWAIPAGAYTVLLGDVLYAYSLDRTGITIAEYDLTAATTAS